MSLAKVFELIRKEQALFWVGSGMSRYAGYPMGKEFAGILYQSLSRTEQAEIDATLPLPQLSEEFVRLKQDSRSQLNALLRKSFLKKPSSAAYHSMIANIPHVKTIITTNYDNLFELAYGNNAIKLLSDPDIGLINGQQEIFKIHGDLSFPETIIITKSDYARFFAEENLAGLYWSVIAERISNKSIVFIGYDLEDDNVMNLLEKTWQALGNNKKEAFLISPGQKAHKVTHLQKKGIHYIDSKAEPFITKLYQEIKDNIVSDYDNEFVRVETVRKFFLKNKLVFDLEAFNEKLSITNVKGLNEPMKANLILAFKQDATARKTFSRLIKGEEFGELEFDKSSLQDFKFSANNINLLSTKTEDYKFVLSSPVSGQGFFTIAFEDGYELQNLEYKIFVSSKKMQVNAAYKGLTVTIIFSKDAAVIRKEMFDFNFVIPEIYDNTTDALNIYKLLERISAGNQFTIYPEKIEDKYTLLGPNDPANHESFKDFAKFFELLKKVETGYKVRFRNIKNPSQEIYELAMLALTALDNIEHIADWEGPIEIDISKPETPLELVLKVKEKGVTFVAQTAEPELIEIYGHQINLGYKKQIYSELDILNLDKLTSGDEKIAKIFNASKTVKISYHKTSLMDR